MLYLDFPRQADKAQAQMPRMQQDDDTIKQNGRPGQPPAFFQIAGRGLYFLRPIKSS